jgi:flavin reductase
MSETGFTMSKRPKLRPVTSEGYRLAMRQVASPVAVIAAQRGGERNGLTATAVCSASADPPILVVCIHRSASAHDLIAESGAFSVNFLSEQQTGIARLFSTPKLDPQARFAEGVWTEAQSGAPLLEGALSAFDCETLMTQGFDSHTVFFGRVCALESPGGAALLYRDGYFRRLEPS